MPPTDRFVIRFAAEPPQEGEPYGRWEQTLAGEFLAACLRIDDEGEELGDVGTITWYPDRTYGGRTYIPATAPTENGFELYGYVSFARDERDNPIDFTATAEFTDETAERNPDWQIDVCDAPLGSWRGPEGKPATMTLVWGRSLVTGGAIVTAELADLAVDQCELADGRFTMVAPDDHRGDTLDVLLFDTRGGELARESLYDEEDEEAEE
jgi:hypothetical protein